MKGMVIDMIKKMMNMLCRTPLLRYLFYSAVVTVIDTAIVWILYHMISVDLIIANTIGVVVGFVIHYILSSKSVFQTEFGLSGFLIYLGTFIVGIILADFLIYTGENSLFILYSKSLRFLLSKGISIVIPFFVLYYLRKYLFHVLSITKERKHAL